MVKREFRTQRLSPFTSARLRPIVMEIPTAFASRCGTLFCTKLLITLASITRRCLYGSNEEVVFAAINSPFCLSSRCLLHFHGLLNSLQINFDGDHCTRHEPHRCTLAQAKIVA